MDGDCRLADVDGTLCVVCEVANYQTPEMHHHFWPTKTRTLDVLRHYFDFDEWSREDLREELLSRFTVKQSTPGEYWIEKKDRQGLPGVYVWLIDGGRTKPIKTEITPVPRPKSRCTLAWERGQWWKYTAAGRKPA